MNGRRLFREYAKDIHKKEAKEFVEIKTEWYSQDTLITKDNKGIEERCTIDYKEMVHWMIKKYPNFKD
jgi:hypothetical protein